MLKIAARFDGDRIELSRPESEVSHEIQRGQPVILRGVFSPSLIADIINDHHRFGQNQAPNNTTVSVRTENYHRIDHNPPKSKVQRILRGYSTFYWNGPISVERPPLYAIMRLRNALSGLPDYFATTEETDGFISAPSVMHYPIGGGYMQEHADPVSKQKCVISAVMSKRGKDFTTGGLYLKDFDGRKIDVEALTEVGDVLVFNPSCRHGVEAIDPGPRLLWDDPRGRWMMFSTLVPLASLNGGAVAGLETY